MIIDSKCLFDVLIKAPCTTKKRLMGDIQTIKYVYQSFEVLDVALVRSEYKIADTLTKNKAPSIMKESLVVGNLDLPIQIWIIRSNQEMVPVEK